MEIKLNVTRRFKVNGKEYGALEEMPAAVREAYEKAAKSLANPDHATTIFETSRSIVFNGRQFASVDAMPPDLRQMYETVMKAVGAGNATAGAAGTAIAAAPARPGIGVRRTIPGPIAPESFSARKLAAAAAVAALLAAAWFFLRG